MRIDRGVLVKPFFHLLILGLVLFNSNGLNAQAIDKKNTQPNIIFILTDDQRWDALGYAGNKYIRTPEMDRLAGEGTYFSNGIVTTPICAASRASIFSGMYERTHLYNFQTGAIDDSLMTTSYPLVMKAAGYRTGFFGKFGVKYGQLEKLFDEHDDYDRNGRFPDKRGYYYKTIGKDTVHLTRYTAQQGLNFIANAPDDKPFCLQLSFSAPHAHDNAPDQYFWTPQTDTFFQNQLMPLPNLAEDKYFSELPLDVRNGFNRLRWTWRYDTPEKYQHSVKGYYRMIADIDLEIGKIRQLLRQKGIEKNTVIIIMGDNGYFMGERQLAGKWLMYDNSIRVPLIIFDPRVGSHHDEDAMALNVDIAPTLADLAGVNAPAAWQGKSLLPLVKSEKINSINDTVLIEHLWEFKNIPPSEGVRTKQWKYFRYVNDKSLEYLYDLTTDALETKNLVGSSKHKATLDLLRKKTDELIAEKGPKLSNAPSGLSTNLLRHTLPVTILDTSLLLSWQIPQSAGTQSAYQLLMASTSELLDNNIGDVWNSNQVRSNISQNIDYDGKPLIAGRKYFWKVRIWDRLNRLSSYSGAAEFIYNPAVNDYRAAVQYIRSEIKPALFQKKTNGYFIDFGKHAFGTVKLSYNARVAETLVVELGEKLQNGKIDTLPGGSIRYQKVLLGVKPGKNEYLIRLKPDTRNTLPVAAQMPDSIPVIMPFRYCQITGASNELNAEDVKQIAYNTYFNEEAGSFSSNDTLLNQVYDLCKYSIKATSFTGLYIDGDRERIPYEADAYLNQLSHYAVDREYSIARNTIAYFMDHPTWPTEWQLHVALMFEADYQYTGDKSLIEKHYDALKHKTLIALLDDNNLVSTRTGKVTPAFMTSLGFKDPKATLRDIVDWPPGAKDTQWKLATPEGERDGYVFTDYNTVINAFFYKNLGIMASFAKLIGRDDDAVMFSVQALKTKQAINNLLFDVEKGAYRDGIGTDHSSIHANMLPLAFDLVPEKHLQSVVDFVKSRGMACSVYGAQYLLDGLYKAGEADYALQLMTSTSDRSWYNMIRAGATISLEAWDMKYKPNADWNHAWGAVPANIIGRQMWGIQPMIPGGAIVSVKPQLSKLKSSRISMPFIRGNIEAGFQQVSDVKQRYTITVPANMAVEFFLPASSSGEITVNGEVANAAFGSIRLSAGKHVIDFNINTF